MIMDHNWVTLTVKWMTAEKFFTERKIIKRGEKIGIGCDNWSKQSDNQNPFSNL